MILTGGPGSRLGLWSYGMALQMLAWAAYAAVGGAVGGAVPRVAVGPVRAGDHRAGGKGQPDHEGDDGRPTHHPTMVPDGRARAPVGQASRTADGSFWKRRATADSASSGPPLRNTNIDARAGVWARRWGP